MNDIIRIVCIGMGIMGFSNCCIVLSIFGVELVVVCDLYDGYLEWSKEVFGNYLFIIWDYCELISCLDIDVVVVVILDYWYDKIFIVVMEVGKVVYCEKFMVYWLDEGYVVIVVECKIG